ncbi:MAG: hypothetical protein MHM6MM_006241, partial [Cercozoa sp. M6MM]
MQLPSRISSILACVFPSLLAVSIVVWLWSQRPVHLDAVNRTDSGGVSLLQIEPVDEGAEPELSLLQFEPKDKVLFGSLHDVFERTFESPFLTLVALEEDNRDLSARTRLDSEVFASAFLGLWQSHDMVPPPFAQNETYLWRLWRRHNHCWSTQGQVNLTATYISEMAGWARHQFNNRENSISRSQWVLDLRVDKHLWETQAQVHCVVGIVRRHDHSERDDSSPPEAWQPPGTQSRLSFRFRLGSSLRQHIYGSSNVVEKDSSVALMTGPIWGQELSAVSKIESFVQHVVNRLQPSIWLVYAADKSVVDVIDSIVSRLSLAATEVRLVHWFNRDETSKDARTFHDMWQHAQWSAEQHALRLVAQNVAFFSVLDTDERLFATQNGRVVTQSVLPAIAKRATTDFVAWESVAQYEVTQV